MISFNRINVLCVSATRLGKIGAYRLKITKKLPAHLDYCSDVVGWAQSQAADSNLK